jgi:hypothetical protein
MSNALSHEVYLVFEQLKAIDRRRSRVIDSVAAHFGRNKIADVLTRMQLLDPLFSANSNFFDSIDEREPEDFIRFLAKKTEAYEAETVKVLREQVSPYNQHVDEQILFGARTAGQDAARAFLTNSAAAARRSRLPLSEAVQSIFHITYNGLPSDKGFILSIRPLSGITVHYRYSAHLEAWQSTGVDFSFMCELRREWISGLLDVFSPDVYYSRTQSCEQGDGYGFEEFSLRS